MEQLLQYFILIPLIGFLLDSVFQNKRETAIFSVAIATIGIYLAGALAFTIFWISNGMPKVFVESLTLYEAKESHFTIDFYFDGITAVYTLVASTILFLVTIFSRYYLHREKGFKRFFNNLLFFFLGLNLVLFAGNLETLFIGWEILGVTSFFLIAFYRDRYLPVKNALKVVSLYRLGDIALLLGVWLCHHYFGESINFARLADLQAHHITIIKQTSFQIIIPGIFLIVALIKSAQLPFSSWLPRAMEGPTTSTAVFYGSLSVHIGVFLLLRTHPLWSDSFVFHLIIGAFGLMTSIVATLIARVQSTIKTQIAYSSIAQIGIMFVEVALGLHTLALFHFVGNAFLRTYQLLVSPSVLSYLIHDQFFNFIPPQHNISNNLWGKIKLSVYILSIKEWNLDILMYNILWLPLKKIGNMLAFINPIGIATLFLPIYSIGLYFLYNKQAVPDFILRILPVSMAILGFFTILKAFTERKRAQNAWFLVVLNQLFTALSIGFNDQFDFTQIYLFLSGIIISAIVGYLCLQKLTREHQSTSLHRFHGHAYEYPRLSFVFLLTCLGLAGFPITPTFIGEDLIIGHIHENQILLTALTALNLILSGLTVYRIFARVFWGPHDKGYHEVAYRSS
ncbi:MAG: proton-conducting transporter membrane subunit [Saprospiraceae bacterium]